MGECRVSEAAPLCPKCAAPMELRGQASGTSGGIFWFCSYCRYIPPDEPRQAHRGRKESQ